MRTIFALATARGKSGVAVLRISGPDAHRLGQRLAGSLPRPGHHALRAIRGREGELLDRGLVLSFEAPASFTGEDSVELQTHGSVSVVAAIEREIADSGLARPAEAGEFTRRALSNGKLDLSQVEALGDLLAAETEAQRRQALRGLEGALTAVVDDLRRHLLRARALIEATIDFVDEDVPVDVLPEVLDLLTLVETELSDQIAGSMAAERVRSGFEVALIGPPNAGKSTLLNYIAKRDVAITSRHAGTTRDVLEVTTDLGGLPVTFLDTAGLRETDDEVESIGIERSLARANESDLQVYLHQDEGTAADFPGLHADISVRTKVDLTPGKIGISGATGEGVEELLVACRARLEQVSGSVRHATNLRHRVAMQDASIQVTTARDLILSGDAEAELVAEHLRVAVEHVSGIIGVIGVENVLGEIFSEFCIGK